MDANIAEEKKPGLSFGFTKKQESRQLAKSVVSENVEKEDNETDYVLSLEGKEVNSTKSSGKTKKQEYVIPLIKQNKWRTDNDKDNKVPKQEKSKIRTDTAPSESLDDLAAKEILQDTARYNEEWEERGKEDTNVAIPLLMQNKVPEGFESDEKLDVALRPDEPDDADYEQIPIEHFGMAMLRGMGWNETRGIGKNGKVIAPVEAHLRPKGLGLGADRSNAGPDKKTASESSHKDDKGEDLELKKNAFCVVTAGINKDLYGTIEGIDEDNSRVMVKLALSSKVVNIMQCSVRLVAKKEFDKFSKYLNKQKADKYKEDEQKRLENGHKEHNGYDQDTHRSESHKRRREKNEHSDSDGDHASSKHKHKKHKKHKDKDEDRHHQDKQGSGRKSESDRHKNGERSRDHRSKHSKSDHKHSKNYGKISSSESEDVDDSPASANVPPWLRNDLRVRIIDKDLKRGKFYKEKVVIIDVPSFGKCVCKTDDGKVVEDVPQSSLETVIPRSDAAHVAIVSGSHRGQIGQVMKRDKDQCLALVQLLSDRDVVLKLQYDEICEFVGDIHNHDEY